MSSKQNLSETLKGKLRTSVLPLESIETLDLKGHSRNDKLVIDIITLDSGSCAPCKYMAYTVAKTTY
jgi:uroporphyrinogen decarboxylase